MAISSFQFKNPVMTRCRYELIKRDVEPNQNININLTKTVSREQGSNEASIELLLQLNKEGDTVCENAAFFAEVAMASVFTWDASLGEDAVNSLLQLNAISLLISYIRPVIANMTYMSPGGALNLPFINVTKLVSKTDKQE